MVIARALLLYALLWSGTAALAATEPNAATAAATSYQRLPLAGARYVDPDPAAKVGYPPTQKAYKLSLAAQDRAGVVAAIAEIERVKMERPGDARVLWSEGWIRLNLRDYEGALRAWQQAETLHTGQPYWVPYSKSMALMGMGDSEAALAWWRVIQVSQRPSLDTPNAARKRFAHWKALERSLLEQVIALAYPAGMQDPVTLGETGPTLLSMQPPKYPVALLRKAIQGEVLMRVRVGRNGRTIEALVDRSSGYPEMDQAAIDSARSARFQMPPSTPELGLWAVIPVRFALR